MEHSIVALEKALVTYKEQRKQLKLTLKRAGKKNIVEFFAAQQLERIEKTIKFIKNEIAEKVLLDRD